MLAIAGQTAGPNGLKFFEGTHGYPGITKLKNFKILFSSLKIDFFIRIFLKVY